MPDSSGLYLVTIGGFTMPTTFDGSGPQGSTNAQDLNYAYGDPNSLFLGKKPGIAKGAFGFSGALKRADAVALINLLAGTTPFTAQMAEASSTTKGWKIAGALCESFTISVSENATAASISGVLRCWSQHVAPTSVAPLTPLASDVLDGISMSAATLLGGSHATTFDASIGMQRSFRDNGRDPATGFATDHGIIQTIYSASVTVPLNDGVDESAAYSPICITSGTVVAGIGVVCLPVGDTGVAAISVTMTNMGYVDEPRPAASNNRAGIRATAVSVSGASTLLAA